MIYKYKETDGIINVFDGDNVVARYSVDYHWQEKNISVKEDCIMVRLYNRMRGYLDCRVELGVEDIQHIPQK